MNINFAGLIAVVLFLSWVPNTSSANQQFCSTFSKANTLLVDPSKTHRNLVFSTLGQALAFAKASESFEVIKIASGTYRAADEGLDSYTVPNGVHLKNLDYGRVVIEGESERLFALDVGAEVIFENLDFVGGTAVGGADNNADDGGAIFAENAELTICHSRFKNNNARRFGGAIYQIGGKLTVIGSEFERNTVVKGEGLVHDQLDDADTDGGAIAGDDVDLIVKNSTFNSNIAGDDGGAIAVRFSDVDISSSKFIANRGISVLLESSNPVFTNDLVTGFGGAVSIHNESIGGDQSRSVRVVDNTFFKNTSGIGSALFLLAAPGSETIVKRNQFRQNGGNGEFNVNGLASEEGVRFGMGAGALCLIGLRGLDTEVDESGQFLRGKHVAYMEDNYFIENESGYGAGMVVLGVDLTSNNDVFYKNSARTRGGAIWSQNFLPLFTLFSGIEPELGVVVIENGKFVKNQVTGTLEKLQFTVFPNLITEPEQPIGGGAIANNQAGVIEIYDSIFIENTAHYADGGALHNATSPVTSLAGVGDSTYGGSMLVENSYFLRNRSIDGSGGAISAGGNSLNGEILDANNDDVRATSVASLTVVRDSLFLANSAGSFGGAIANWNAGILQLENSH